MKRNTILKKLTALLLVAVTLFTCLPLTAVKSQAAKEYPQLDYTCDQPLFEFNSPVKIFGDYDESLGFKAKLTTYLAGSAITASGLWKKVYYDLLYKAFNTNKDWHQFDEAIDDVQEAEKWIANLAFSIVTLLEANDPAFKAANLTHIAANAFVNIGQDTIAKCMIQLKPILYLAENASNEDIRAAAKDLIGYECDKALGTFVDDSLQFLLDEGIEIGKENLGKITKEAFEQTSTEALKYLPRLLAWVNITLVAKDVIFFASGQGDVLDGYINLVADFYLRQELYSYHSYLKNQGDTAELANNFYNILFVTKDLYNNFKRMMGDNYDKIIDNDSVMVDKNGVYSNDELLKNEYELLNSVTIDNYYKRVFDIMKPEWDGKTLYLYPQQETHQLVIPGIRYGVNVKFDYTSENKCFTMDKKTGFITLGSNEGTGKIRVTLKQNGEEYKFDIPVKVAHVQPCTNLRNDKYSSTSVKLKWDKSINADYYVVYQRKNNAWKRIVTSGVDGDTFVVNGLNPGTDYSFAVVAYAVANNVAYSSKTYPTLTTSTRPETPENFKKKTVTDSSITVTWNAAKGATGYRIYNLNTATGKWNTAVSSTTALSATFNNLPQNKSYTLAVRAYYKSGKNVVWSESYPTLTVKTAGVPDAPANLTVSAVEDASVTLTWSKAKNASGYLVYRYDAVAKKWIKMATLNKTAVKITGLTPQTVYNFAVRSYNNEGTKVFYSKTYPTITAVTGLGTVTGFKSAARNETAIKFTWDKVKNATGYRVYKYNTSTGKWDTVVTTDKLEAIASNLSSGTVYKFAVRAYFKSGNSVVWAKNYPILEATTLPGQVKNFKGALNGTIATFTWDKVKGADGYIIYSYETSTKKYTAEKIVTTNSATIENLKTNTAYHYVVVAYKSCNGIYRGNQSSFASLLTLPTGKEVAYMFNKAYAVADVWLEGGTSKIVDFSSKYYESSDYLRYYKVEHSTINTKAKLEKYLYNYFSTGIISNSPFSFNRFYKDINGELYAAPLNIGGGVETLNLNTTTAEFYNYQNGYPVYKVSYYCSSVYNSGYQTKYLIIKPQNNKWVFDNYFSVKVYSSYTWDGKSPLN